MDTTTNAITTLQAAIRQHGTDTAAYAALGHIKAVLNGDLILFNYTPECTYERRWNDVERVSRGIIFNVQTAELVALPFPKFFNLGEMPETALEALPAGPVEITEKMDGSLGILYRTPEGPAIATRGSFTSAQAQWATAYLRANYPHVDALPADITLLFEIIYPANRIVVNYQGQEGLWLLGARRFDGYDYPYEKVQEIGELYRFPVTPRHEGTVEALLPLVSSLRGVEGWVIKFTNDLRVKIKTEDYMLIHRFVSRLSPATVKEALYGDWRAFLVGVPEEHTKEAERCAAAMLAWIDSECARLTALYKELAGLAEAGRKMYALAVMRYHKEDSACLFALLDGRDIRPMVLKALDPAQFPLTPPVAIDEVLV